MVINSANSSSIENFTLSLVGNDIPYFSYVALISIKSKKVIKSWSFCSLQISEINSNLLRHYNLTLYIFVKQPLNQLLMKIVLILENNWTFWWWFDILLYKFLKLEYLFSIRYSISEVTTSIIYTVYGLIFLPNSCSFICHDTILADLNKSNLMNYW